MDSLPSVVFLISFFLILLIELKALWNASDALVVIQLLSDELVKESSADDDLRINPIA